MSKQKYYKIIGDRLTNLLGILPDERLIHCVYNEIATNQVNVDEIQNLDDEVILAHYLEIQEFLSL